MGSGKAGLEKSLDFNSSQNLNRSAAGKRARRNHDRVGCEARAAGGEANEVLPAWRLRRRIPERAQEKAAASASPEKGKVANRKRGWGQGTRERPTRVGRQLCGHTHLGYPCFTVAGRRLCAASSLRLLGERATSGVPSNQAPPRDPRSAAFYPAKSAPPADRRKARKGWAGEGPREARGIRALVLPRELGGGGEGILKMGVESARDLRTRKLVGTMEL